ncbi:helix-turn-helix transcriptional regulator [Pseudoflavitalea sp. G-6-1-2]|nr:helix-turn-helix transcriptional regulator [Pseudoflavitalea sp. G-6-1-2]
MSAPKPKYNNLKVVMVQHNMDNRTLAQFLDMSVNSISLWRTNKAQPDLETIHKIAGYLKCDPRDIIATRTWPAGPSQGELDIAKRDKLKQKPKKAAKKTSKRSKR